MSNVRDQSLQVTKLSMDHPSTFNKGYSTEIPDSFPIGEKTVKPFVNVTDLQAHLVILGAFSKLKSHVEQLALGGSTKEQSWVTFVNRAVARFYKWINASFPGEVAMASNEATMPPLDVLMVWHSYLLNPRTYYEDSIRKEENWNKNLQRLSEMDVALVASLINPDTQDPNPPTKARKDLWESLTRETFNPPLVTLDDDTVVVSCPCCANPNVHNMPWWTNDPNEPGYAQPGFKFTCVQSGMVVDRTHMGMRRFCDDLVGLFDSSRNVYLSETLLDPVTGQPNTADSAKISKILLKDFQAPTVAMSLDRDAASHHYANQFKLDPAILAEKLRASARQNRTKTGRKFLPVSYILEAYQDPGLAGVELVGAVLRQGGFIENMVKMGWTTPRRFGESSSLAPLVRAIARYHAFLFLMERAPDIMVVPTLDIDLAWHTHQLNAKKYREETLSVLGTTPNHRDSVPVETLSTQYDVTARAWKALFGSPYAMCSCATSHQQEAGTPTSIYPYWGVSTGFDAQADAGSAACASETNCSEEKSCTKRCKSCGGGNCGTNNCGNTKCSSCSTGCGGCGGGGRS